MVVTVGFGSCSKFPPSLCAPALPAALSGELSAAAAVPMDAFLLQLLPLGQFADVVLQVDLRESKCLFKNHSRQIFIYFPSSFKK